MTDQEVNNYITRIDEIATHNLVTSGAKNTSDLNKLKDRAHAIAYEYSQFFGYRFFRPMYLREYVHSIILLIEPLHNTWINSFFKEDRLRIKLCICPDGTVVDADMSELTGIEEECSSQCDAIRNNTQADDECKEESKNSANIISDGAQSASL